MPTSRVTSRRQFLQASAGVAAGLGLSANARSQEPAGPLAVKIRVDAAKPGAELKPIWRFFGCDEPNYAYMKDGKKLLGELERDES